MIAVPIQCLSSEKMATSSIDDIVREFTEFIEKSGNKKSNMIDFDPFSESIVKSDNKKSNMIDFDPFSESIVKSDNKKSNMIDFDQFATSDGSYKELDGVHDGFTPYPFVEYKIYDHKKTNNKFKPLFSLDSFHAFIKDVDKLAQKLSLKLWSPINLFFSLLVFCNNFNNGKKQRCIKKFLQLDENYDEYKNLILTIQYFNQLNIKPNLRFIVTDDLTLSSYARRLLDTCNIAQQRVPFAGISSAVLISNIDFDFIWRKQFYNKKKFNFINNDKTKIVELMFNNYSNDAAYYHDKINDKIAVAISLRQNDECQYFSDIEFILIINNNLKTGLADLTDNIFNYDNYVPCSKYNIIKLWLPEFEIENKFEHLQNQELFELTEPTAENIMFEEIVRGEKSSFTGTIFQESKIRLDRKGVTFKDEVKIIECCMATAGCDFYTPKKIKRIKYRETIVSCIKPFRFLITRNKLHVASGYVDGSELISVPSDDTVELSKIITPIAFTEKMIKEYCECKINDKDYLPSIIFKKEFGGQHTTEFKEMTFDNFKLLALKYQPECDDEDIYHYYNEFLKYIKIY